MIGTLILAALAAFLGWLTWATPDPGLAGMFLLGTIAFACCAVAWFLNARQLRRSSR